MKIEFTVENLEERKNQLLQSLVEIRNTYLDDEFSNKHVLPVVAVIDGRSIPTWAQIDLERDFVIEIRTSPTECSMSELTFDMSEEEMLAFLDAEEQIHELRMQLQALDTLLLNIEKIDF
ncbi:hypothetical protein [Stutzerimonas nitrititolerans]|jgi:hypothetical protein|uniref:hypothetical protein n=1 Tax=Stutzerimonas nitrititolerans TaxID=2482751 RepID=UPI00289B3E19|nr:hypothetical protein [Stutzerimonas nitrititolerans]